MEITTYYGHSVRFYIFTFYLKFYPRINYHRVLPLHLPDVLLPPGLVHHVLVVDQWVETIWGEPVQGVEALVGAVVPLKSGRVKKRFQQKF